MRKNGVKKQLTEIQGGVCAPLGFSVNGVSCGLRETEREDLLLIRADSRCACAYAYAQGENVGAPVRFMKKRAEDYARAVIANGGIANAYMQGGEIVARDICRALSNKLLIREEEIAIASTGEIGELPLQPVLTKINELVDGLGTTDAHLQSGARAITGRTEKEKYFAYSFELGAYTCKIGGIIKGNMHVCPNMATTLCFLTTDVNIAPKLLQKAFSSAVQTTLNLLNVDGVSSPNDFACILANGRAGNYQISAVDTEYAKFANALHLVMANVCEMIASSATEKYAVCRVLGARSIKTAKELARAMAGAQAVRRAIEKKTMSVEEFVCALCNVSERIVFEKLTLCVNGVVLLDGGRKNQGSPTVLERVMRDMKTEISISIGAGNYSATSVFCV